MKHLIVLVGIPASGKSTYRQKAADDLDTPTTFISSDDYLERRAEAEKITYSEAFKLYADEAQKHTNSISQWAFQQGHNVIWDQTNLSSKKRRKIINMAPSFYKKTAVVFKTPFDVAVERNSLRPEGRRISDKIMLMMRDAFQPIEADEGFDFVVEI